MLSKLRQVWSWIYAHIHWILFIIGLSCFIVGYIKNDKTFSSYDFLHGVGELILIGCVFSFFSSYRYITMGYRKELSNLLYGDEFLRQRKDIDKIWESVSKIIFCSRLPKISNKLLEIIKCYYFPVDSVCYYHDYVTTIRIRWDNDDRNYIIVEEDIKYKLIADTKEKFTTEHFYWVNTGGEDDSYAYARMEFNINGNNYESQGEYSDESKGIFIKEKIELSTEYEYVIIKKVYRRYKLENDNFICYRSKYIVNNMDVNVVHPQDLQITFVENGVQGNFDRNYAHNECCIFKYKGLILSKQGYIIILTKK